MRKKTKKKTKKKKIFKKKERNTSFGIIPLLLIIALLALFSETVRTIPAGAFSEKLNQKSFEVQRLNFELIENKIIKKKEPIFIAKVSEKINEEIDTKILNEEKTDSEIIEIPKVEETIKLAEDKENKLLKALDDISKAEGTGTSINNKNITYIQILQNPNDLDLNLKYAQQQGKMGNYKQTISTLERLNMIYPDNVEIKLYLLSVLVQIDSPEKANTIIEEMKLRRDLQAEDLETLKEIEQELQDREPSLWALTLDTSIANAWSDNVNSVSKTRLKKSSDSLDEFGSAKHDRTGSGTMGISATRPIGEQSSFLINFTHTTSDQYQELDDDFQSYGLTFGFDTVVGNQSLSPYLIMSKTDNMADADAFSFMYGIGGFFSVGERNSISYGYSFTDSKSNHNSEDGTANEANAIGHGLTLGHDFVLNTLISTSIALGYSDSDAKVDGGNDAETYDFGLTFNFAFPWAFISVSSSHSFNDYKRADSSIVSDIARSDYSNTFSLGLTKAIGDFFPTLDPNRSTFINLGYENVESESNIINYDYEKDSFSISFSKSLKLN
ncbi:hypothetical protein OAJ09_00810 [Candidatus Pelagibacter sp.]|nr:hypothetical protein [Candidatus Pelagibacter sp.]